MNERIRELAEQATFRQFFMPKSNSVSALDKFNGTFTEQEAIEKFAELIVAGAIGVLQKRFMGDLNREDMEVRRCIEDLKKYFGVEE
jgi:hypothetical protein